MVDHHRRHFVPEGAILAIAGDFDARRLARLVRAAFGGWPRRAAARPAVAPVPRPGRPRVRRIQRPGDQVHLLLGHLGVPRNHPDYDALLVLDHVFGSGPGFSDRLGRIVRDEMGLVYAIGGGITDSADILPGVFRVYAGTMPEEADRVVATITEQVRAMRSGAFSDEEVERARRYLAGAWVFDYHGVEQRAERLLEMEALGPAPGRAAELARPDRGDRTGGGAQGGAGAPGARVLEPRRAGAAPAAGAAVAGGVRVSPAKIACTTQIGHVPRLYGMSDPPTACVNRAGLPRCPALSPVPTHILKPKGYGRVFTRASRRIVAAL